jgi:sarcosine oxidase, subunit beta
VKGLKQSGGQIIVSTNRGDVKCDTLVNATGPRSAGVASLLGLSISIKTVRRQTALFESNVKGAGMLAACVDMSTDFYVYGSGQGTSVCAGLVMNEEVDPNNYHADLDLSYLEKLGRAIRFRAPGLGDLRKIGGWASVLDVTPDSRPIIGPHPDMPALVNCTMGGFGIQLSPIIGKLVAEMIVNGKPVTISDVGKLKIERFTR